MVVPIDRDILAIFRFAIGSPSAPVAHVGTGFLISDYVLVTCWHCVSTALGPDECYGVPLEEDGFINQYMGALKLENITQASSGADLAWANIGLTSTLGFSPAREPALLGQSVFTYGYPLTGVGPKFGGGKQFLLEGRYLQGYVMRRFNYKRNDGRKVPSYELDMPTPEGLSGAPIIKLESKEVLGVVYATNDVALIEELSSIDPDTGVKSPEIQRLGNHPVFN